MAVPAPRHHHRCCERILSPFFNKWTSTWSFLWRFVLKTEVSLLDSATACQGKEQCAVTLLLYCLHLKIQCEEDWRIFALSWEKPLSQWNGTSLQRSKSMQSFCSKWALSKHHMTRKLVFNNLWCSKKWVWAAWSSSAWARFRCSWPVACRCPKCVA